MDPQNHHKTITSPLDTALMNLFGPGTIRYCKWPVNSIPYQYPQLLVINKA
jgi:hypothetical protein